MEGSSKWAAGNLLGATLDHGSRTRAVEQLYGFAKEVRAPAIGVKQNQGCGWPDVRQDKPWDPTAASEIEHSGGREGADGRPSAGETEAVVYVGGQGPRPEKAQFPGPSEDVLEPDHVGLAELTELVGLRWSRCRLFWSKVSLHERLGSLWSRCRCG